MLHSKAQEESIGMSEKQVIIVESPTKAKIMRKYLGEHFTVLASFGHICDLPVRDGSVRPHEDFAMDWALDKRYTKHLDTIIETVKGAKQIYLATDPDREGEAIAWHVLRILDQSNLLKDIAVHRISFHEITEKAIKESLAHPTAINQSLVDAYLARRALDYLVGFTLSPVLWHKLPGSRSAGRVQSVALRLICEREAEIEIFRAQEYWTIELDFKTVQGKTLTAWLSILDGHKLDKFALENADKAEQIAERLRLLTYHVESLTHKQSQRHPAPPFTTSTLQQEASRKLSFGAMQTMRLAQKLYEGYDIAGETLGLITYMRTDNVQISDEAISAIRQVISTHYPSSYLPSKSRRYKSTAKNAQEAHEAIRPTMMNYTPKYIEPYLDQQTGTLYELIWKRVIASQMSSAILDNVVITIVSKDGSVALRATRSTVEFDGFMHVYQEDQDEAGDQERFLPSVEQGESLTLQAVRPIQHYTHPPPRYTEASLVKKLEELGLGRPSTYASILQVLRDRDYVYLENKRFIPADRGRLVTMFLERFFARYVEYTFTADLENQLDEIAREQLQWKTVLRRFWDVFISTVEEMKGLTITQVLNALDETMDKQFFPDLASEEEATVHSRICPICRTGRLGLRLSRMGAFIGCSSYPQCQYKRPLTRKAWEQQQDSLATPRTLGTDPITGCTISMHNGPFGIYVQHDLPVEQQSQMTKEKKGTKPKRVTVPRFMTPTAMDLDTALQLLALPRELGPHPTTGVMIIVGIGRLGSYLKYGDQYTSLAADENLLTLSLDQAVILLAESKPSEKRQIRKGRLLGVHPEDGESVMVKQSRYGFYVTHGKMTAPLSKNINPEDVTLEHALDCLATKQMNTRQTSGKKVQRRKKSVKKETKRSRKTAKNVETKHQDALPSQEEGR